MAGSLGLGQDREGRSSMLKDHLGNLGQLMKQCFLKDSESVWLVLTDFLLTNKPGTGTI